MVTGASSVAARGRGLVTAVGAAGAWITSADGSRFLDGAGGALVNGVGHGQLTALDYVHATTFTTEAVERYATELAAVLPLVDARVFPVSGGSEAAETALKLARAFHVAGGEPDRTVVLSRWGSYHGNTLGALDASGRRRLRQPFEPWLGRFQHLPGVNEYRCPNPDHPDGCGRWHAQVLEARIIEIGEGRVAALVAEPVAGATLAAAVPSDDYWPAVAEVCARHGVLLIADEVMTGFGRTGRWFAGDHWGLSPDIVVCAKGASSGYWPLGVCAARGDVWDRAESRFGPHGFTFSHHPAGAAAGLAVLSLLRSEGLVERSATMGRRLATGLREAIGWHGRVGDIRGSGLMMGIELVEDRETRRPFPPEEQVTERVRRAAFESGLLVYPAGGCAAMMPTDPGGGDAVMLGPPLIINEEELEMIVGRLAAAVVTVLGRR